MTADDRRLITETATGWLDGQRAETDDAVRGAEAAVEDLAARLRSAVRTLHDARARQRGLAVLSVADLERDAAVIAQLPGVAAVAVRDEAVEITTRPITIAQGGAAHELGTFRIELSPQRGARVFLHSRPPGARAAWIHPHVQADLPCLGNARVGVEKLLGDVQLATAAEVMLRFLSTYDPETAYCDLAAWPTTADPGG